MWKLCLGQMCIDLLCCLSGLCLSCGVPKLNCWNLVFSTSGGSASFVEFDAWFDLPWFEGELVIRLGFRGSMIFCHWKTMCFVAALQSFELAVCHPYGLIWGGAHVLSCILYILLFIAFSSYSPKSLCFTCYTACICLIMLIIMLGWVVMRCELFC
jgi:hypothetical protein